MRSDIRPGGTFPDYTLPDHTDTERTLSEIQGDDPLVLTLARGNYCPNTLVLKPGLLIHSIYNGYWFWGRLSCYDLWRDLRAASSENRPDWDLGQPGLREAWNTGDYSSFHGWSSSESSPPGSS
jgi:hypothetical protein